LAWFTKTRLSIWLAPNPRRTVDGRLSGGWFCPCHGSHYDTSGRIRKGPASEILIVPRYALLEDLQIRIG
jgi:ubiquinol-cytochrome c reductase iron-sulfur subunit